MVVRVHNSRAPARHSGAAIDKGSVPALQLHGRSLLYLLKGIDENNSDKDTTD